MSKAIYLTDAQHALLTRLLNASTHAREGGETDELLELIAASPEQPKIVLDVEGGLIHCVRSNMPMEVLVLDDDTEGGDVECIRELDGKEVYVSHYLLQPVDPGYEGVDAEHVEAVLAEYHEASAAENPAMAAIREFERERATIETECATEITQLIDKACEAEMPVKIAFDDFVDDQIDELKGTLGRNAANNCRDDDGEQEDTIENCESWVADNISQADLRTKIAAVLWLMGPDAGLVALRADLVK